MRFLITCLFVFLLSCTSFAQSTQSIRGTVLDKESHAPLPGVVIRLVTEYDSMNTTTTNVDGKFVFQNSSLGRKAIHAKLVGYRELSIPNIIVDAGKETILNIELEESTINIQTIEVTANTKAESTNEMSTVSSRQFSVEESNRYAGSRSDPARMASNYAGVQGANDSRNDIVIRGNSPMGLLWRINDIDIPNPNHFAVPGTTGGAVSIINNKTLANSDFMTGAFPAEYGNANAGVFDLKMRNGNNQKHEFTGQFGFLGTEVMAEGPLSKEKGSTYLLAYRYSTLKLFESFKIKIGTSAVPAYQDLAFKLNFPMKNGGNLSLFGIGGTSNIAILVSNLKEPSADLYGLNDRDQYFNTSMGLIGVSYTKSINDKTFFRITLAGYGSNANAQHDLVFRDSTFALKAITPKMRYTFITGKTTLTISLNKKFNSKHSIKTGVIADQVYVDLIDSIHDEINNYWNRRFNTVDYAYLIQPYIQWKYKITEVLTLNAGLHGQYLTLGNSVSIEPRAGLRWVATEKSAFSIGYGLHSQMQPLYTYYYRLQDSQGKYGYHNKQMDITRSNHFIIGYDYTVSAFSRIKIEGYYQQLFNIPIDKNHPTSFSLVNQGSAFSRFFPDTLTNKGIAQNYGIEFTFEKFFSKSYFLLFTASLYNSTYKGSDGIERNTDFNGNYAANALAGKEFTLGAKKNKTLSLGTKITYAGGKRYSQADTAASRTAGEVIYVDSKRNSLQFRDYFRLDAKIGFKINTNHTTHEFAIDIVNILNTKNILGLTYAPDQRNKNVSPIREEYQLGFLPLFYYKIDF